MRTKQFRCFTITKHFILSGFCFLLLPGYLLAQKSAPIKPPEIKWQLDATVNGVQFYHRVAECAGKTVVLLKFNNTNSKSVKISWNESFVVKENKITAKQGSFGKKQRELLPGKMEQADCETASQRGLVAWPTQRTPVNTAQIVNFTYTDIEVEN